MGSRRRYSREFKIEAVRMVTQLGHPVSEVARDLGVGRGMEAALGDTAVARLFDLLASLQFTRRRPTASDFNGACDIAQDVARDVGVLR